jgi:XTP/dITP diphosphohydrolase
VKLLLATTNAGKIREYLPLLKPFGFEVLGLGDLGLPAPDETASNFAGNAQIKARAAAAASGLPALADDSGLCLAALGGGPGVHSARYAGGDYAAAMARLCAAARDAAAPRARFVCALSLAVPDGQSWTYNADIQGHVAAAPAGAGGFGYDAIFIPLGHTQTFAEMGAAKDAISHRALAWAQLAAALPGLTPMLSTPAPG